MAAETEGVVSPSTGSLVRGLAPAPDEVIALPLGAPRAFDVIAFPHSLHIQPSFRFDEETCANRETGAYRRRS